MLNKSNILKFLRVVFMLIPLALLLAGCDESSNQSGQSDEKSVAQQSACWQGKVLLALYDTAGSVAMKMYKQIIRGAPALIMVAFALWLSLRLLKFVGSVSDKEKAGGLWNDIAKQIFFCFICAVLVSSTGGVMWVLNSIIFPVYNAFLEFGSAVLTNTGTIAGNVKFLGTQITFQNSAACTAQGATVADLDGGFPESARNMMQCSVCALSEKLNIGFKLSFMLLRMKGLLVKIIALVILVGFTIIKLSYVFYLVDAVFKFTVMVVMLPVFIIAYAFEATKGMVSTAFKEMIAAAVLMCALSIVIALCMLAIISIIGDQEMFPENAANAFKGFSPPLFCLMAIAFLIISALNVAAKLSPQIAGAQISTKFQEGLKALVQKVLNIAWGGAMSQLIKIDKIRKLKKKIDEIQAKAAMIQGKGK